MTSDTRSITIRMTPEERRAMTEFMARHGMDNVSAFIRMAIRWAVEGGMA